MAEHRTRATVGFGFDSTESTHHFALLVPDAEDATGVLIEERYTFGDDQEPHPPDPRARIDAYMWRRIASEVQAHFNRRLKDVGGKTSRFTEGANLLAPFLGKELTLLLWAVDGIDPTDLPNALANWQGLAPEERWWLYATVKASGSSPDDGRDRGWRKAIRIAFTENPAPPPADGGRSLLLEPPAPAALSVAEPPQPYGPKATKVAARAKPKSLSLFEE